MKRDPKIFVQTFGCQMNVHDSTRILEIMESRGYERAASPSEADVIVVNTCSVREKAYLKGMNAVGSLRSLKERARRHPVIVVAGCVARQEREKWIERHPHVDVVMGPDALARVDRLVRMAEDGGGPVVDVEFDGGSPEDFVPATGGFCAATPSSFVTIMKGCNGRCSFCIVPSLRGPERCRPPGDILRECRLLVEKGAREIFLLGQTVNSWRYGDRDFADLLGMVDAIDGVDRIRYTSPYPGHMTTALAGAHGDLESLCEHVHLPVQSGSNKILALMNRNYTREDYLAAIDLLRGRRPDMAFSTDVIVGFPGEKEGDFEETLDLVSRIQFDTMFSFKYSPRPGTAAASLDDDVPPGVKQERLEALHRLSDKITASRWKEELGREVEVLVEKKGRLEGQLAGRTRKNRVVNFTCGGCGDAGPGDLVKVKIDEILPHSLRGRLV